MSVANVGRSPEKTMFTRIFHFFEKMGNNSKGALKKGAIGRLLRLRNARYQVSRRSARQDVSEVHAPSQTQSRPQTSAWVGKKNREIGFLALLGPGNPTRGSKITPRAPPKGPQSIWGKLFFSKFGPFLEAPLDFFRFFSKTNFKIWSDGWRFAGRDLGFLLQGLMMHSRNGSR